MGHRKYYDSSNEVKSQQQTNLVNIEDGISDNQYVDKIKQQNYGNCGDQITSNETVNHGHCKVKEISVHSPEDKFSKFNFFFFKKKKDYSEQHLWGKTSRYIRTTLMAPKCDYNLNEEAVIESPKIRNELVRYGQCNLCCETKKKFSDVISTTSKNVFKKTPMGFLIKKSVSPISDAIEKTTRSVLKEINNDKHIIISRRNENVTIVQPHDRSQKKSSENQQSRNAIVQRSTPNINRFENYSRKRLQTSGNENDFVFDFTYLDNERTAIHNDKNPYAEKLLKLIYNVNIYEKRRNLTKSMRIWIPILFVAITVVYLIYYVKIFSNV
ncbi:hypothetical protein WA026_002798 [Henosepilachna vigintioctopunctata]|uniref:Uncharacterized protein n=1 Tax=Henosepilachna vigintioctopunctata TaxID=420089 RepID=A0AAW1U2F1_9CUCU